ncbi:MAG: hypothetical protein ACYTGW_10705 [Planctomycetota bacterium]|jgi:peptidoglycan/LPS O-acetylase OafA/YrhL
MQLVSIAFAAALWAYLNYAAATSSAQRDPLTAAFVSVGVCAVLAAIGYSAFDSPKEWSAASIVVCIAGAVAAANGAEANRRAEQNQPPTKENDHE